jgi:HSP20 family protein
VNALLHSALGAFPSLYSNLDSESCFRAFAPALPVEVAEHEDHFLLRIEVPGVKRDNLEVTIDGRVLILNVFAGSAVSDDAAAEPGREVIRSKRIALPESIEAERVSASLEDGILEVTLPKLAVAKARVISIA